MFATLDAETKKETTNFGCMTRVECVECIAKQSKRKSIC